MSLNKISDSYVNNEAAWVPLRTVAKKLNEAIDAINSIIGGSSDATFNDLTVTGTATIEDSVITSLDAGSFTMNKTAITQTSTITTTVVANRQAFQITTVSSTLASNATATFTCTNSTVTANSTIVLSAHTSGNGIPVASVASKGSGTFDIKIINAGSATLNNTVVIQCWVIV